MASRLAVLLNIGSFPRVQGGRVLDNPSKRTARIFFPLLSCQIGHYYYLSVCLSVQQASFLLVYNQQHVRVTLSSPTPLLLIYIYISIFLQEKNTPGHSSYSIIHHSLLLRKATLHFRAEGISKRKILRKKKSQERRWGVNQRGYREARQTSSGPRTPDSLSSLGAHRVVCVPHRRSIFHPSNLRMSLGS